MVPRKKKLPSSDSSCSFKQLSIVNCIRNMRSPRDCKPKIKFTSPIVIDIEENVNNQKEENMYEIGKRKLPIPIISDSEDENQEPQSNIMEDENRTVETTPKPKTLMLLNKPNRKNNISPENSSCSHSVLNESDLNLSSSQVACYATSTPQKSSLNVSDNMSVSPIPSQTMTEFASQSNQTEFNTSTDSESTLIYENSPIKTGKKTNSSPSKITVNDILKTPNKLVIGNNKNEATNISPKKMTVNDCTQKSDNISKPVPENDTTVVVLSHHVIPPNKNVTPEKSGSPKAHNSSEILKTPNNSPVKRLFTSDESPSKKRKAGDSPGSPKKEKTKGYSEALHLIVKLFTSVYKMPYLKKLLTEESKLLKTFLCMNVKCQYVVLKLFTWKLKWYNIFKYCGKIGLELDDHEILEVYNVLEREKLVETDYSNEDSFQLLTYLDRIEVKKIYEHFRLKKTAKTKEDMIKILIKNCQTQSTLTFQYNTMDLLKRQIKLKMGKCVKLKVEVKDMLYRIYLLATFTNPLFANISDFMKGMLQARIVFPEYETENYVVFYTRKEFLDYADARKCKNEIVDAMGQRRYPEMLRIAEYAFEHLQTLISESNENTRNSRLPYLKHLSAEALYASTLTTVTKTLTTKHPEKVKEWLEYMIENVDCERRLGDLYHQLIWIYMRYADPKDFDRAAILMIEVLTEKRQHLSEVQLHKLGELGEQLKKTKKIEQLHHGKITELIPKRLPADKFRSIIIDAKAKRSSEKGKRDYLDYDREGNMSVMSVEEIARQYYIRKHGYTTGMHGEGGPMWAMFALFFWDIIYSHYVQGTFLSALQSVPLDMFGNHFYDNRKTVIDKRIKQIESEWSEEYLLKFAKTNWNNHSHQESFVHIEVYIRDLDVLEKLVVCVGRKVLAKIFERLVRNYKFYRSGMPDLLMWNTDTKRAKFVEVKGENDKLSVGQKLWLEYLIEEAEADAEVCHVHSIGSKKKSINQKKKDE